MAVKVIDSFRALATTPRGAWPLVRVPKAAVPHFPWQSGISGIGANPFQVSIDIAAQCMHPSVLRIPTHNVLEAATSSAYDAELASADSAGGVDSSYQTITWTAASVSSGYGFWPVWGADTNKEVALYAYAGEFADADAGNLLLEAEVDCQAFRMHLDYEPQPAASLASGDLGGSSSTASVGPELSFHFAIGEGADRRWYRVLVNGGQMFLVQTRLDDEETWTGVQSSARPKNSFAGLLTSFYKAPSTEPIDAEVRLLGGKLTIRLGVTEVVLDEARKTEEEDPIFTISALKVEAKKALNLLIRASQDVFHCVMTYESPQIPTGFISSLFNGAEVSYAIDDAGWNSDLDTPVEDMLGPDVLYRMTWTGPVDGTFRGQSWSRFAPAIRAVILKWDPGEEYLPESPVELSPSSWTVEHIFDPAGLTIESAAELGFNSNKPQLLPSGATGTWGEWIVDTGQFAVQLEGARTLPDGSWPGDERLFTGYGNTSATIEGSAGNAGAKIRCQGRSRQLMSPVPYLPWMDGWNSFYAISLLAQMRGVSIDDMAFADSIPESPFEDSLDEDGEGAWFLPVGPANSVLVRPTIGEPIWFKMRRIAREAGYLLYWDLFGMLQYRKFRLPSGPVKRSFFESDVESYAQLGGGLEGCWNAIVQKSMDQVRSQLVLMGPSTYSSNSSGLLTVAGDTAVIDDGSAFNHLGYECESVWIDTQFSVADYALEAGQKIFANQRTPFLGVTFTTWYQPDMYPLDLLSVESVKLGTAAIPMLALSVRHSSPPGGPARSTITGLHFVPE